MRGILRQSLMIGILSTVFYAIPIIFAGRFASKSFAFLTNFLAKQAMHFLSKVPDDRFEFLSGLKQWEAATIFSILKSNSTQLMIPRAATSNVEQVAQNSEQCPDALGQTDMWNKEVLPGIAYHPANPSDKPFDEKRMSEEGSRMTAASVVGLTIVPMDQNARPSAHKTPNFLPLLDHNCTAEQDSPQVRTETRQSHEETSLPATKGSATKQIFESTEQYLSPEIEPNLGLWQPNDAGTNSLRRNHGSDSGGLWQQVSGDSASKRGSSEHREDGDTETAAAETYSSSCPTSPLGFQRKRCKPLRYWFDSSVPDLQSSQAHAQKSIPPRTVSLRLPDVQSSHCGTFVRRHDAAKHNLGNIKSISTGILRSQSYKQGRNFEHGKRHFRSFESLTNGLSTPKETRDLDNKRNRLQKRSHLEVVRGNEPREWAIAEQR